MQQEHPSAYFLEDRSSRDDLTRLQIQDQMLTRAMGGVLPEQHAPAALRRVLDVGCGTGGWLIETARTYPTIEVLAGVDVSTMMVQYARQQATIHQLDNRVEFHTMDALRMLEFPDQFFDLVNQRSGISYLRTWEWSKLLQEYKRVLQWGGTVRMSEGEWGAESTSPALTSLFDLLCSAFYRAGHSFTPAYNGVTSHLEDLLHRHGFEQIQSRLIVQEYHAGTPEWQHFFEDMKLTFRLILPFLRKWTPLSDNYDQRYQQAVKEMQHPDFVARGNLLTVWGTLS